MWVSRRHGPADEPPTPEQVQEWQRLMSPPENELPGGVGLSVLLGRTDDAAVGITQIEAFSTGFQFTLAVRLRRARPEFFHGGLFTLISAHGHPGVNIPLADRPLLGVEYADGRRASTLHDMRIQAWTSWQTTSGWCSSSRAEAAANRVWTRPTGWPLCLPRGR